MNKAVRHLAFGQNALIIALSPRFNQERAIINESRAIVRGRFNWMTRKQSIHPYNGPAGGWGALRETEEALAEQHVLIKGARSLLRMNQPKGFKCPSCAWPDPSGPFPVKICENGAKALAWEATAKRVTREFFAAHPVSWLEQQSDYWLEGQGRLTEPMVYDEHSDRYVPIAWDQAFARIGRHLNALDDPDQAEFYTSGRASNEAAFLYQLFVREFGTNNFPDCSNMCHEATSVGLPPALGVGKATVVLDDFNHADAIFIFGQNPGTNSPRMLDELHAAARRGVQIVTFNPLKERALERFQDPKNPIEMATFRSTPISTHYFQVRVGGDCAALKGMMKALIEADDEALTKGKPRVLDADFINTHTHGFDALAADLRVTSWAAIERQSGLTRADLTTAARIYAGAKSVIAAWGMGITQHRYGTQNVQQIVNLLLLRGNIGRSGAGALPVRGHSNVQGDRTVGITERPTPEFLDRLKAVFGFEPPRNYGHAVVETAEAIVRGDAKVFVGLGGNFIAAIPDTEITSQAMRRLNLTVGINTKLNRGHLVHGRQSLILPCIARSELDMQADGPQFVTLEDSTCVVQASDGCNAPASPHLLSEPAIIAGMARATLPNSRIDWGAMVANYDRIRDAIEAVFPIFKDFNARVRKPGGFHLTSTARNRIWETPTGKANFLVFPGLDEDPHLDDPGVLRLTTIRSHDQFNTTVYALDDRYRGIFGQRRVLFLSREEMEKRGLAPYQLIDLKTVATDNTRRIACGFKVVPYDMPAGACAAYYPETNGLVPLYSRDEQSGTPTSKSVPVRILPSESANQPFKGDT
jgi:molybdopterin-dependent oxidoreductase alpha subunit